MRRFAVALLAAVVMVGCSNSGDIPSEPQPHPPAASEDNSPQPEQPQTETQTPLSPEEIAAGFTKGMACADALEQMPEPMGSFRNEDVVVTGIEVPEEGRITYVWEIGPDQGLLLTCLDGEVLGVNKAGEQ